MSKTSLMPFGINKTDGTRGKLAHGIHDTAYFLSFGKGYRGGQKAAQ